MHSSIKVRALSAQYNSPTHCCANKPVIVCQLSITHSSIHSYEQQHCDSLICSGCNGHPLTCRHRVRTSLAFEIEKRVRNQRGSFNWCAVDWSVTFLRHQSGFGFTWWDCLLAAAITVELHSKQHDLSHLQRYPVVLFCCDCVDCSWQRVHTKQNLSDWQRFQYKHCQLEKSEH